MKVLNQLIELKSINAPTNIVIGIFDGVHLGHQYLLSQALKEAQKDFAQLVVLTFSPHPLVFFNIINYPFFIQTFDNKTNILKELGIKYILNLKFDQTLSKKTPEEFISDLSQNSNCLKKIIVGKNWKFGKGKSGDISILQKFSKKYNYKCKIVETLNFENSLISSTKIRESILKNDFDSAKKLLGRDFTITKKIVHNEKIGKKIGFPTANLLIDDYELPKNGVYAVEVKIDNQNTKYKAIANLGIRPSVSKNKNIKQRFLEVHIFNFQKNIYNCYLEVNFVKFLREEKYFQDINKLKLQIQKDSLEAKTILF